MWLLLLLLLLLLSVHSDGGLSLPPLLLLLCLLPQEVDELGSDDDDDDEGAEDTDAHRDIRTGDDVDAGEEGGDQGLKATEIDAYWLQREISKYFAGADANAAQKLSEDVFAKLEATSTR